MARGEINHLPPNFLNPNITHMIKLSLPYDGDVIVLDVMAEWPFWTLNHYSRQKTRSRQKLCQLSRGSHLVEGPTYK